jgi:hypothetical protein
MGPSSHERPSRRVNILELQRIAGERVAIKQQCYSHALASCHRRVRAAAEQGQFKCLIRVPEFIPGLPVFPIDTCVRYVADALNTDGFTVRGVRPPNVLLVSWAPPERPPPMRLLLQPPPPAPPPPPPHTHPLALSSSLMPYRKRKADPPPPARLRPTATGKLVLDIT